MSEMSVNWGELMAGGAAEFQPVPKGNYDVFVDAAEPKQSTTGKLMFALKYKIESGPQAGRTVFNNITLTTDNPNALRFFFLNMKAMNITQEFFAQNPSPSVIAQALIGQHCRIEVDHRPYQGQMRENVKSIMPAGGTFAGGAITGPSAPISGLPTAGPVAAASNGIPSPQMPTQPVSAPVAPVPTVAVAPVAPSPSASPVSETVSTATIPAPSNPAPAAEVPAPAADPTPEPLPPGFTDRAQYDAFLAFQRQQAEQAAAPVPAAAPAPSGAPVPPPLPF